MSGCSYPDGGLQQYYGLYPAVVTDLVDPEQLGRIEVKLPWLGSDGERDVRAWATLLSPYADNDQGLQALPEVDSQVVVGFEAGNLRRPYIVGACWNGLESLPVRPEAANNKRVLQSRAGSKLELDDTAGAAKVTLSLENGHQLVLDGGGQTVTLRHSSGSIVTIGAAGQIEIRTGGTIDVHAGVINFRAPVANFDALVTCATLIASSGVVSPSYTPGAGNVW